jgi:uncharacterized membrane protein YkvA (DUF1232 family)
MADMTFGNSTYAGTAAVPFVAPAILSADTIANGYCSVLDNVRYKTNLRKVSGGTVEARTCGWGTDGASNGTLDISDVQLTLTELQVNEEICNHELARTWAAAQMRGNYAGVPGDYEQFLAQYVASRVAEDVEKNIWAGKYNSTNGTTTGGGAGTLFDSVLSAYVAGAGTHETLVSGAFTNATIDDRLASLVADLPDALIGEPNTKIYMSRKSFQLYFQYLAANDNNPVLATQMAKFYLGYEIITPAGFPDDTLVASRVDNLYFGTNVLTDHVEARFIDLRNTTGADLTRILMMFDGGTQIVDEASMACVRRSA